MLASVSPEPLSMTMQPLMNDESVWQMQGSAANRTAALQLVGFEVAHDLCRVLLRISGEG